jgi:uncharacterized membrane protein YcaP (DUF421 family)
VRQTGAALKLIFYRLRLILIRFAGGNEKAADYQTWHNRAFSANAMIVRSKYTRLYDKEQQRGGQVMGIAFLRTVILYIFVIIAVRFMGKRQIGELQPSELVVTILISELAAIPMQETGIPLVSGFIPIVTLVSCEIILSAITLKSYRLRRLISGKPSVLIRNGVIDQKEMKRQGFTLDDLMEEIRLCGYMGVDEVAFAICETNGKLSVFPTSQNKPVTAGMMNLTSGDGGLPVTIICDGMLSLPSLAAAGKDMLWLQNTISAQGLASQNVFLMTVDSFGKTIIIPKEQKP